MNAILPFLLSAVIVHAMPASAQDAQAAPAITTIPSLEVPRYMGKWYEIAKFPNRFQRDCVSNTSATYSVLPDGRVKVVNRCRQADGSEKSAEGVARQPGGPASPKLEVRFAPAILSFIPMVWGDYWVIDLDQDYRLAAVSDRKGDYLWILSRTPTVDQAAYDALTKRIAAQGLDITKLEATPQR
ncbi:MAG: lipocalin family protein [Pseudomonadota bacterium]